MSRSKAGKLGDVVRVIIAEPIPGSRSDEQQPESRNDGGAEDVGDS